eukprot:TRINITY_DN7071_c0_g1_i1.p1 TRINITY_DN7071_c0_g1~~TRINITY_DN7071_c0_g1_i1.p1  ORF type:complete len:143 (-),score=25.93 TRINITY_DN7071_c0_g1_i1:929-1357(-)
MGQTETAVIKAYNESKPQVSIDIVITKRWKKLDKTDCGVLYKKEALKFLTCIYNTIEKERKNWDVGVPILDEIVVNKWYKMLDPLGCGVISLDEVLRHVLLDKSRSLEYDYKNLLLAHKKMSIELYDLRDEMQLLKGHCLCH